MKIFENKLSRLIIIGMNELVCETVKFCENNNIDFFIISSKRMRDVPMITNDSTKFQSCSDWITSRGYPITEVSSINVDFLKDYVCDDCVGFSFDSPFIIKKDVINLFKGRIINEHGAHLPHGKGGGGFSWRIMENDREGNVLFHFITEKIDEGPIIFQKPFVFPNYCRRPIEFSKYQHTKNIKELGSFLTKLKNNEEFEVLPQNNHFSSYMPRIHTPTQAYINWNWDVSYIEKFILAFSDPYEGAKSFIGEEKIYIKDCFVDKRIIHTHPYKFGIIFNITKEGISVACKNGTLVITDSKTELRNNPKIGDRLHTSQALLDEVFNERVIYTPKGLKK